MRTIFVIDSVTCDIRTRRDWFIYLPSDWRIKRTNRERRDVEPDWWLLIRLAGINSDAGAKFKNILSVTTMKRSQSPPRPIPIQASKTRLFDAFSNDSRENELNQHALEWSDDDDWEQDPALDTMLKGEPLFDFTDHHIRPKRIFQGFEHRRHFYVQLRQRRNPTPTDNVGREFHEVYRRSVLHEINGSRPSITHHTIYFAIKSKAFRSPAQSRSFTLLEFTGRSRDVESFFGAVAYKINIHLQLNANDVCAMERTFVLIPPERPPSDID